VFRMLLRTVKGRARRQSRVLVEFPQPAALLRAENLG
jgi:hypothetical protein